MLVLTRKVGQCVVIGGGIVVQVLELRGRRIRLGIEAPSELGIRREELSAAGKTASAPPRIARKPR